MEHYLDRIAEEPISPEGIATLDEPVSTTLKRDARMVALKLFHVVCPRGKGPVTLRDWDLWGPLVFCFMLAAILAISSDNGSVFTIVFFVVGIGSVVITANAQLVGAKASFFQCLSVLGYCVFPLVVAALIGLFLPISSWVWFLIRLCLSLLALAWSTWATVPFFASMTSSEKRLLVIYPVFLFYLYLMFMVLVGKSVGHPEAPTPTPTPA